MRSFQYSELTFCEVYLHFFCSSFDIICNFTEFRHSCDVIYCLLDDKYVHTNLVEGIEWYVITITLVEVWTESCHEWNFLTMFLFFLLRSIISQPVKQTLNFIWSCKFIASKWVSEIAKSSLKINFSRLYCKNILKSSTFCKNWAAL